MNLNASVRNLIKYKRQTANLLTVVLTFTFLCAFGQTEVKEKNYKIAYRDTNSCYSFEYDINVPHLAITHEKDIRQVINDSIASIAKSSFHYFPGQQITPNFVFDDSPCDSIMLLSPEMGKMTYQVYKNTTHFISIKVSVAIIYGGGGHGGGFQNFYLNADLINNRLVSLDDLFAQTQRQKLNTLTKARFDKEQNMTFDSYMGQLNLDGITVSDTGLNVHYSVPASHSVTWFYDVTLAMADIKKLLNKNYSWLFSDKKRN